MGFGLLREHALSFITVALAFSVLLVCILNHDFFVHHVLAVHVGDGGVSRFEIAEGDEAIALGDTDVIARNLEHAVNMSYNKRQESHLGGIQKGSKTGEGLIE